jgi:hypothetical protein
MLWFQTGKNIMPTSVYGNKVVGYEDAMRTITQEMGGDECSEAVRRLNLKKKIPNPNFKVGVWNFK